MIVRSASFRVESFCPNRGIVAARPEANEKKLRSRGGFQAALSPYNMSRQNKYAGKTKQKKTLNNKNQCNQ